MRYFITGVSGFVARHFIAHTLEVEEDPIILGVDLHPPRYPYLHDFRALNLLDIDALRRMLCEFSPDFIVHLASFSSVARSWDRPLECFSNNTNIFLNLLEVVRTERISTRILSVGSSEEYGAVDAPSLPLREEHPLHPISPYAVARVAQEQLSEIYAHSYGLDIVMTRSFNHVGVGQEPIFAIPSLVKQFHDGAVGGRLPLKVGDVSIVRDFLDVRDVVRAYRLLLKNGNSGEVYNVCKGEGRSILDIIQLISELSGKEYLLSQDPSRIRPNDNRVIIGDHSRITNRTNWEPMIDIGESLKDIYSSFQENER